MSLSQYKAVLFDLDGTLLQVEMRSFIPRYIASFHACCRDLVAFEPMQRAMRSGIHLLLETEDGQLSNDVRFFSFIAGSLQQDEVLLRTRFAEFLASDLDTLSDTVQSISETTQLLECCGQLGIPLVLATNPVFPRELIEARCRWAGIDTDNFSLLTSMENSRFCKPQSGYFLEVAEQLGVNPRDCLMVGNDTSHDLAATKVGMTTWLVDSYLLERDGPTWEPDYRGNHLQLLEHLRTER